MAAPLPPMPVVADVGANNQLQNEAPGAGEVAVGRAAKKRKIAEKLNSNPPPLVSDAELGRFVNYERQCVEAVYGAGLGGAGGGAVAPPWFAPAIAPITAAIAANTAAIAANTAAINNSRIWARNQASLSIAAARGRQPIELIAKERPGFLALPNAAAPAPAAAYTPPVAAVFAGAAPALGGMPPPVFPAVQHTSARLNRNQIGFYARWYNDTFGIIAADSPRVRMEKFFQFLAGR